MSMKELSQPRVELIFGDGITATVRDKLHGTEALRPNQYLEWKKDKKLF